MRGPKIDAAQIVLLFSKERRMNGEAHKELKAPNLTYVHLTCIFTVKVRASCFLTTCTKVGKQFRK